MIDDKKLYKEITLHLEDIHIRQLIDINKIIIKGFRTNKKLTGIKLNSTRLKLSNKQYIKDYIDKLLKYYTDTNRYDFSWALVDSITVEDIRGKVNQDIINEGEMILALLWAKRKDLLIEYLEIEPNEEMTPKTNSLINTQDESTKTDTTEENLRKIIKSLEEERKKDKNLLHQKKQAIQDLGAEVIASKDQTDRLKKKLDEKISELKFLNEEIELLKEKIIELENHKEERIKEKKLKLICIGAEYTFNFFIHHLKDKKEIEYEILSPETLKQLETHLDLQVVILAKSLNKNETAKIRDNLSIKFYHHIGRVKVCNDALSFIDFLEKVGKIYE